MGKEINISMLQMSSIIGDIEANIKKVKNITEQELPENCDVLVLPEVWTCGWACDEFIKTAQNINNSSVIDFLTQDRISALQSENAALKGQISQAEQNAFHLFLTAP